MEMRASALAVKNKDSANGQSLVSDLSMAKFENGKPVKKVKEKSHSKVSIETPAVVSHGKTSLNMSMFNHSGLAEPSRIYHRGESIFGVKQQPKHADSFSTRIHNQISDKSNQPTT